MARRSALYLGYLGPHDLCHNPSERFVTQVDRSHLANGDLNDIIGYDEGLSGREGQKPES